MNEDNNKDDYVKQLEDTVEILTSNMQGSLNQGYWVDRHIDKIASNPIVVSELKIVGITLAYAKLNKKTGTWISYSLRRIETKKFSGYEFLSCGNSTNIEDAKMNALRGIHR